MFLLGAMLAASIFAPLLSRYDPDAITTPAERRFAAPSSAHWFGTDQFGRDLFARVLHGGRVSLLIALAVVTGAVTFGALYGALSGYFGGWWDQILMRVVDALLAFPLVFLAVTLMAIFGTGLKWLIIILILGSWMDIARLVRAEVLSLKQRPFIVKARAAGLKTSRILFHHLLPNTLATILAAAILRVADVILIESALSFLGLGAQPPTASWGAILNDGKAVLASAWWITAFPGLAIVITVLSINLIGESLRQSEPSDFLSKAE